ncbi:hypothetical protein OIO90_004602 [Microbotryomycetes sp. JL221]|nr:hypothetical protein OIO90_004602 [Microbotryomycetes sp. JL221]
MSHEEGFEGLRRSSSSFWSPSRRSNAPGRPVVTRNGQWSADRGDALEPPSPALSAHRVYRALPQSENIAGCRQMGLGTLRWTPMYNVMRRVYTFELIPIEAASSHLARCTVPPQYTYAKAMDRFQETLGLEAESDMELHARFFLIQFGEILVESSPDERLNEFWSQEWDSFISSYHHTPELRRRLEIFYDKMNAAQRNILGLKLQQYNVADNRPPRVEPGVSLEGVLRQFPFLRGFSIRLDRDLTRFDSIHEHNFAEMNRMRI